MRRALDKALGVLKDSDSGWVNRRDAAVDLGTAVVEGVRGLQGHARDSDKDVQESVLRALRDAGDVIKGIGADAPSGGAPSLERLVEAIEKKGSRDVSKSGDGYEILVTTSGGRSQKVFVEEAVSNTKRDVIRVTTRCAKAEEKAYVWALTNNASMSHCSLAIETIEGEPWLVLVNNLLKDSVSYAELKLTVKEVALYGDWVEEKLTGEDVN